jgi:hypothetical protein
MSNAGKRFRKTVQIAHHPPPQRRHSAIDQRKRGGTDRQHFRLPKPPASLEIA